MVPRPSGRIAAREAGKTLPDCIGEVREAVDFLHYYAAEAEAKGPWNPRGVFVCISPWNFPLAIFTGQIAAALAVGNTVIAKPAEATPLIAARARARRRMRIAGEKAERGSRPSVIRAPNVKRSYRHPLRASFPGTRIQRSAPAPANPLESPPCLECRE